MIRANWGHLVPLKVPQKVSQEWSKQNGTPKSEALKGIKGIKGIIEPDFDFLSIQLSPTSGEVPIIESIQSSRTIGPGAAVDVAGGNSETERGFANTRLAGDDGEKTTG